MPNYLWCTCTHRAQRAEAELSAATGYCFLWCAHDPTRKLRAGWEYWRGSLKLNEIHITSWITSWVGGNHSFSGLNFLIGEMKSWVQVAKIPISVKFIRYYKNLSYCDPMTLRFLVAKVIWKQRSRSLPTTCTYEVCKLTLNTLRKCLDPGIHFNKFNVGEDFTHFLNTVICSSYTFSPEICSDPRHKHLKEKKRCYSKIRAYPI